MSVKELEGLVKRLEVTTQRLEALSSSKPGLAPKPAVGAANGVSSQVPPSVKSYDEHLEAPLKAFMDASKKLGGDIAVMAEKVSAIFDVHRQFIWTAAGRPEPDAGTQQQMMAPLVQRLGECAAFKDSKKTQPKVFNHLSAVAEGLQALGWVTVKPTPGPFVKEMLDVAMFFVNRVRTENKGDTSHADWAKTWCEILTALQAYIKQCHTTGIVWNSAPGSVPPAKASSNSGSPAPAGGAPPPPPPPPADLMANVKSNPSSTDSRQALFAEINKGEAITSGLKKVTADMQTHKNPALRGQTAVPATSPAKSASAGKGAKPGATTGQPPKIELKDMKVWQIEFHNGNRDIKVETDMKQSVYVYRCENSVVQIKGKVNSVIVDSCKKTSVVFDSLLSQIEVINSQSVEVQSLGALPTISIQKTDGCQVYLSKESMNAEIVTSKSSEMNVLVPKADGEFAEFPVPEQFKTTFDAKTNKLSTVVSDIV